MTALAVARTLCASHSPGGCCTHTLSSSCRRRRRGRRRASDVSSLSGRHTEISGEGFGVEEARSRGLSRTGREERRERARDVFD